MSTGLEKKALYSSECRNCHKTVYEEWKNSLHSQSWTDPLFQKAFEVEKKEWCIHCHSPLEEQKKEYFADSSKQLLEEGINCVACHVREGVVLGSKNFENEYHKVIKSDLLYESEFCGNCHQFNFPRFQNNQIHYSKEPMQNTYFEWKETNPERNCQSCHYEGHLLLGTHSKNRLQKDFTHFKAEISEKGLLHVSFDLPKKRGHILPTGDLYHSLEVRVVTTNSVFFSKKWARFYKVGESEKGEIWNRSLKKNTGLRPEEEHISLTLDTPETKEFKVEFVYHFHDEELGGKLNLKEEKKKVIIKTVKIKKRA